MSLWRTRRSCTALERERYACVRGTARRKWGSGQVCPGLCKTVLGLDAFSGEVGLVLHIWSVTVPVHHVQQKLPVPEDCAKPKCYFQAAQKQEIKCNSSKSDGIRLIKGKKSITCDFVNNFWEVLENKMMWSVYHCTHAPAFRISLVLYDWEGFSCMGKRLSFFANDTSRAN